VLVSIAYQPAGPGWSSDQSYKHQARWDARASDIGRIVDMMPDGVKICQVLPEDDWLSTAYHLPWWLTKAGCR